MKPTPTPEANTVPVRERIERLVRDVQAGAIIGYDGPQEYWSTRMGAEASAEIARLLSAALSVQPAAAVVGEPVGYVSVPELVQLKTGASCVDLFRETQPGGIDFAPVYAAPSAPDGWQPIETAPRDKTPVIIAVPTKDYDGHIVGEAYFDPDHYEDGDWWWANTDHGDYHGGPISEINFHGPSRWQALPAPPALGGASHD